MTSFVSILLLLLFIGVVVAIVVSSLAYSKNVNATQEGKAAPTERKAGSSMINPPAEVGSSMINPPEVGSSMINPSAEVGSSMINPPAEVGPSIINPPAEVVIIAFSFSSGTIVTSAVSNAIPRVLGTGNSRAYTIHLPSSLGESTIPDELDQYSQPIPYDGTLHTLQLNCTVHASAVLAANVVYEFRVLRAIAGPNNTGESYSIGSDPFLPLTSTFGYKLTPLFGNLTIVASQTTGNNLISAQNLIAETLAVVAGQRIAVRVIVSSGSAADIGVLDRLGFSANLGFTKD